MIVILSIASQDGTTARAARPAAVVDEGIQIGGEPLSLRHGDRVTWCVADHPGVGGVFDVEVLPPEPVRNA